MPNYSAIVAKLDRVFPIEKADFLQSGLVLGENVVISKNCEVGMIGLLFLADSQLSYEFCHNNNLHRHIDLNKDSSAKPGMFDDNRKVRAQTFKGCKSAALFVSLDTLQFTGADISKLRLGDRISVLNGIEISKKFMSPKTLKALRNSTNGTKRGFDCEFFYKHVDTDQYKQSTHLIKTGDLLSFHAKVHGTSFRVAKLKVTKKPVKVLDKIKNFFGRFEKNSHEFLLGSRNVILDKAKYECESYKDKYRVYVLNQLKPYLETGMIIYGEIAGYDNETPIMGTHDLKQLKDKKFLNKYGETITYKYNCSKFQIRFHIYRISMVNENGTEVDFTNQQVINWCESRDILAPFEIYPSFIYDGDIDKLNSIVEQLTERNDVQCEDYIDKTHISEGIVIRIDNERLKPRFLKNKSYPFKVLEGIFKEDNVDLEDIS